MKAAKDYNEQDILRLIAARDTSAMRLLYDRFIGSMTAVCARYIPDGDDRKDVLQESFIRIMSSIGSYKHRGEGSLKGWMLRIAANESLRFLERNAPSRFVSYEADLPDVPDEPDVEGVPDDEINSMILKLPPGYRMVFNLYVFGNLSHKEIAKRLGIAESSSASQYMRARQTLARMIKEYRKTRFNE